MADNNRKARPAGETGMDLGDGELILEPLFVNERPTSEESRPSGFADLAAEAEDAEFIDYSPSAAKEAATPKKSGGGLGRLFSRKPRKPKEKPTPAPAAAVDVEGVAEILELEIEPKTAPVEEEGLVLDVEPPAASEPPKAERKPRKVKKERKPKVRKSKAPKGEKVSRFGRRPREIFVMAELRDDRALYWRLDEKGVESVDSIPDKAKALSFSTEDLRFEVDAPMSHSAAEGHVLREVGEAVHLLNRSKELGAIYATLEERIEKRAYRLGPAQLLVDRLVRERAPAAAALIIAVELKDASGRDALMVLYYLSATGRCSEPQISVYPDNREFLISQFAATHQAAREQAQVLLLNHADLHTAAARALFYPNEPVVGGIPVRKLWLNAAAAGVVGAALCAGWAYQAHQQYEHVRSATKRVESSVELLQRNISATLAGSPRALAEGLSLDLSTVLARSSEVWVPGAYVRLTADGFRAEYQVTLMLLQGDVGRRGAVSRINTEALKALLHLQTPADCERSPLNFDGRFNEAQLNIRCEAPPHPLDRYRSG